VSLHEQVGRLDDSLREPLAQYLDGATVLMSAGTIVDPLDAEKGPIVPFGFSADGEWAWPTCWTYFVREWCRSAARLPGARSIPRIHPKELTDEEAQGAADGIQKLLYG
jgi:hypothetical protein